MTITSLSLKQQEFWFISAGEQTQLRRPVRPQPIYRGDVRCPDSWEWRHTQLSCGYCHTNRDAMVRLMLPLCSLTARSGAGTIIVGRYRSQRLSLTVDRVRVERVQEISRTDAQANGSAGTAADGDDARVVLPEDDFAAVFQRHCGKNAWKHNVWVWVIEFTPKLPKEVA